MATYAIGDIQGCYLELEQLLDHINFDTSYDQLWFVGDIVNRGPESLRCLRFVKSLGKHAKCVLGNHELHLLAISCGAEQAREKDTFDEILQTPDLPELLDWLRNLPLLIHDPELNFVMVHAGLPAAWSLQESKILAHETEQQLKTCPLEDFFKNIYGNKPDLWDENLAGKQRYRFILNGFTRMRYCTQNGQLELTEKCPPGRQHPSLIPWYKLASRKTANVPIVFGHWSTITLGNDTNFCQYNIYPTDTGCVWGRKLTAIRLEDRRYFSVVAR